MVTVLIRQRFAHCQQCYDLISGIIIYLCAFSMLFRGKIQSLLFRNAEKTNVNAEPAPAAEKTKKEGK